MRKRIAIVLTVLMLSVLFSCPAFAESKGVRRSTEVSAVHFYSGKAYYEIYEINTMTKGRLHFSSPQPAVIIRNKKVGDVLYVPFDAVQGVLEFFKDVKYRPGHRAHTLCKNGTVYVSESFLRNFGVKCTWER